MQLLGLVLSSEVLRHCSCPGIQVIAVHLLGVTAINATVVNSCSLPVMDTTQMPWDPGASSWDRLGDKPIFKGGGLSVTILLGTWAGQVGLGLLKCYQMHY
jgi:hypothetical protein